MNPRLLEVEGLSKSFGVYQALKEASFSIAKGEILGVIGPNGAGKTTLLESVAGLLPADSGVFVPSERKNLLFYMPDGAKPFAEQKGQALITLFLGLYAADPRKAASFTERLALKPALNKRVGELSKGTLKRLLLLLALLTPQPLLLLDEPFDGLDPHQVRAVMALLRETRDGGRSLILSIHQLADAERVCDRLLLLCAGQVVGVGTLEELRKNAKLSSGGLEEVFFALT